MARELENVKQELRNKHEDADGDGSDHQQLLQLILAELSQKGVSFTEPLPSCIEIVEQLC